MECDRQNVLSLWTVFCPFTPIWTHKIKIWKNEKNTLRYYHFTNVYHKWQSYDIWFFRYRVHQTKCFVILEHFVPFYLPNNLKNQNFEKLKKTPGDIIILHKCTKNHDHMLYCSLNITRNGCNYFSLWAIFCPFPSLKARKIKILKKWKKCMEISSFYINVPKIMIKNYGAWQM